eukprot:gene7952-biopygen3652
MASDGSHVGRNRLTYPESHVCRRGGGLPAAYLLPFPRLATTAREATPREVVLHHSDDSRLSSGDLT